MNSIAIKKKDIALIIIFTVGSLIAFGFTGKVVMDMQKTENSIATQHKQLKASLKNECIDSLKKASHSLEVLDLKENIKVIGVEKISNSYNFLTKISGSIQSCNGFEMDYFCMGDSCEKSYFTMNLKEA